MKKVLGFTILLTVAVFSQSLAQQTNIFPKGKVATNTDNYTGKIWLNILSHADSVFHYNVDVATYKAGSKLDWHIHPGGQILLITEGTGYYQEKGKPGRIVHQGDIIKCQPGVEHWHAAAPNSTFAYVAISPTDKGKTIWFQNVTDKEYHSLKSTAKVIPAATQGSSIFPKGFVAPNTDDYTGTVWLNGLSRQDSVFHFSLMKATFAPGSRLRWHIHPDGQVLLILKGTGYYMEKGKPGRIVHQGDVIKCTPGVPHTHLAAPNSNFAYIGIESHGIKWLHRVTDEEYQSMSKQKK